MDKKAQLPEYVTLTIDDEDIICKILVVLKPMESSILLFYL